MSRQVDIAERNPTVFFTTINRIKHRALKTDLQLRLSQGKNGPQNQKWATCPHNYPFPRLSLLYNTLVRPHLENAMQVWSPTLVTEADCLVQIQRFTSLLKGYHIKERQRRLGLHILRRRRLRGDLIATNKLLFFEDRILTPASYLFRHCSQAW